MQGLLKPSDRVPLEQISSPFDALCRIPDAAGINHDVHRGTGGLGNLVEQRMVVLAVLPKRAVSELNCREARVDGPPGHHTGLMRVIRKEHACVSTYPISPLAPYSRHGLTGGLASDVPERLVLP